ncbi:flavin reductase [Aureitalea sp. L0-47]|uniref:flavin reductase family protein n=1 Tax=Aureitalea sp. L0-47 TaxID=2816962 RepID=UPI002238DC45|nr:flavin reductase family protein [Aureitalea sp. L0-47]MCW5518618.1 flavin reductase [Aureitalea sp. L0-47]
MDLPVAFVSLDITEPIWSHFFTVAPLVIIGTKEGVGYDMAPKHMATPMGFNNYFGFVCTPNHSTYHNVVNNGEFSVSYLLPKQVIQAAISASPRSKNISKSDEIVTALPTINGTHTDTLLMEDAYVRLECKLHKIIDGFDENCMITGKVISASVHPDYLRVSEKDESDQIAAHPLLAYVADGRFASVSETFNFPYPKNFCR